MRTLETMLDEMPAQPLAMSAEVDGDKVVTNYSDGSFTREPFEFKPITPPQNPNAGIVPAYPKGRW